MEDKQLFYVGSYNSQPSALELSAAMEAGVSDTPEEAYDNYFEQNDYYPDHILAISVVKVLKPKVTFE